MSTPQNGSVGVTLKQGAVTDDPKVKAALEAAAQKIAKESGGSVASVEVKTVGPEAAQPVGDQPTDPDETPTTPAAPAAEQPAAPGNSGVDEEVDDGAAEEASTFLGLTGKEWIIASVGILVGGMITYALVKIFADGSTETIDEGTGI